MNNELLEKVSAYRAAMAMAAVMLEEGIITEKDYRQIDTIMARKYGVKSSTIFR
jgi:hypothetical protein